MSLLSSDLVDGEIIYNQKGVWLWISREALIELVYTDCANHTTLESLLPEEWEEER